MSRVSAQKLLCRRLSQELRSPDVSLSLDKDMWVITGQMKVGSQCELIEINFYRHFPVLKLRPPKVWCRSPRIKRDVDWHVYSDSRLCWVLPQQWRDVQGWQGKSNQAVAIDASTWLLASVHLLLSRHLMGHLKDIVEWPLEWDQWRHAQYGLQEYRQEKTAKRFQRYRNRKKS